MITAHGPVLGMILKGYPRISETFISNEILLLENLRFYNIECLQKFLLHNLSD